MPMDYEGGSDISEAGRWLLVQLSAAIVGV